MLGTNWDTANVLREKIRARHADPSRAEEGIEFLKVVPWQSIALIRDLPPDASLVAKLARAFVYIQVFGNISQPELAFFPDIS
jgi:hypothetical protein